MTDSSSWERQYICIDLKSFYASCECVERGLDPMTTDLVVADASRTDKTICLAVSPSLKTKGVRNRCRVFEIPRNFTYVMAPPRMKLYIDYSANIYAIYLKYIAKEDIHVYSIDEAFMDVTNYLDLYGMTTEELGETIRSDIYETTGIPATCGAGPNLYLAKIALDITAKHSPNFFGVLDEDSFKEQLWNHRPLTDFWRIGKGTARRLETLGITTMGQIALYPYPEKLYKLMGKDAEILIDHAWGREPTLIEDIKAYKSKSKSVTSAQVLGCPYSFEDAKLVIKEMTDTLCLDIVDKGLGTDLISLAVGYDGEFSVPSSSSRRLLSQTNSHAVIGQAMVELFDECVDPELKIKRMMISFGNILEIGTGQLGLFAGEDEPEGESDRQKAINSIKHKFGKNAILKGMDLMPNATQMERNRQIGGHKSGE